MANIDLVIQIGNSDGRLNQSKWSEYAKRTLKLVETFSIEVHFSGGSDPFAKWQNACFSFCMDEDYYDSFIAMLQGELIGEFNQDSIAILKGQTFFVESKKPPG